MPPTENQGSFLNRISIRRNHVTTIVESENESFDTFSKHVTDRFATLVTLQKSSSINEGSGPNILSVAWVRTMLDAFLSCEAEFRDALITGRDQSHFGKPPLDRLMPELLDRTVKAMDICNAITSGIDLVRTWQKLAQIGVSALEKRPIGEGQVRRAKKAFNALLTSMLFDDKDNLTHNKVVERPRSIALHSGAPATKERTVSAGGSFRSSSWSMAKSWSAAKQIQAMSSNLVAPRGGEQTGLALPVYVMSNVLVFVMWALVAAIPCQEQGGLSGHLNVPRQFEWAKNMIVLHEKIGEEWNKKEKKGVVGLLEEIQKMERLAKSLVEFADSFRFPLNEDEAEIVRNQVAELVEVCIVMEEELVPLQQLVRKVFHRLVKTRAEILDVVDQIGKLPTHPTSY